MCMYLWRRTNVKNSKFYKCEIKITVETRYTKSIKWVGGKNELWRTYTKTYPFIYLEKFFLHFVCMAYGKVPWAGIKPAVKLLDPNQKTPPYSFKHHSSNLVLLISFGLRNQITGILTRRCKLSQYSLRAGLGFLTSASTSR